MYLMLRRTQKWKWKHFVSPKNAPTIMPVGDFLYFFLSGDTGYLFVMGKGNPNMIPIILESDSVCNFRQTNPASPGIFAKLSSSSPWIHETQAALPAVCRVYLHETANHNTMKHLKQRLGVECNVFFVFFTRLTRLTRLMKLTISAPEKIWEWKMKMLFPLWDALTLFI